MNLSWQATVRCQESTMSAISQGEHSIFEYSGYSLYQLIDTLSKQYSSIFPLVNLQKIVSKQIYYQVLPVDGLRE